MESIVLKVVIERRGACYNICARSGNKDREAEVDPLPATFQNHLYALQDAILRSPIMRRSEVQALYVTGNQARPRQHTNAQHAENIMIQEIGSQLFDFIFQKSIRELYNDRYKAARKRKKPLLIRLTIRDPDLSYAPWETLYDKDNHFHLTASSETPFTRAIMPDEDDELTLRAGAPVRILGMAARAKTLGGIALDAIDVDAEQLAITKALEKLQTQKKVKLSWIPSAQVRDLSRALGRGDEGKSWDIFHFIGHGGHDGDRGYLVIQENGGPGGAKLYSENLRLLLIHPGRTPNLVILNSCSGATGQPGELFSSTAVDLIEGGIPAVIAMQFEISDAMGVAFSESFYTHLTDNYSIQGALTRTRAELKADGSGEWISPVLYMRTADGTIFKDTGE